MKSVASILALDPGRTTGYAIAIVQDGKPYIGYIQEELNHKGFYRLLDNVARECDYQLNIICEDFHFRRTKTGVDLYPCELIGILHYFEAIYPSSYVYMQNPAVQGDKSAYYTDAKLKELKLYQKEFKHGRSAVKHLLHWLHFGHGASFNPIIETSELVTVDWARSNLV